MNVLELYTGKNARTSVGIASVIESAVRGGKIPSDFLLPTVRGLAEALGVSPATAASAYRRLRLRGVVVTGGRRGTRVSGAPPLAHAAYALPVPQDTRDLSSGNPDPALLPNPAPVLRTISNRPVLYGHDAHDRLLLELARDGFDDDGVACGSVTVVSGALDGVERVLRAHLAPGDRVGLEDPGWRSLSRLVQSLNLIPAPVAIDDDGMLPDALRGALRQGLDALIVTPRAQNPVGAALEPDRARELIAVVTGHPSLLVLEDDHAGPVSGARYASIAGSGERWAVVRSVSKSFGPDLRIALMAGDQATIARVQNRILLGPGWVSHVLQRAVAGMWSDPATPALLERAAETYRTRREALINALARRSIPASGKTGLNVWIEVGEESGVVAALLARKWAVAAGEEFRMMTPPAIRVTISTLVPDEAEPFADDLASVLSSRARTPVA